MRRWRRQRNNNNKNKNKKSRKRMLEELDREMDEYWARWDRRLISRNRILAALDRDMDEYWAARRRPPPPAAPAAAKRRYIQQEEIHAPLAFRRRRLIRRRRPHVDIRIEDDDDDKEDDEKKLPPALAFRRTRFIAVTEFSSQAWCEQAKALQLSIGRRVDPERQAVMDAGVARHRELEEEVHKVVDVETETRADRYALHFLNLFRSTRELLTLGRTREMPVIGCVALNAWMREQLSADTANHYPHGVWMIGIIDNVVVDAATGRLCVTDTKTRKKASVPGIAQKRASRMQLMMYRYFLGTLLGLPGHGAMPPCADLFRALDLDPSSPLSEPVRAHALSLGMRDEQLASLGAVVEASLHDARTSLAGKGLSDTLEVVYELQGSRDALGEDKFEFDAQGVLTDARYFLRFWLGIREPNVVPFMERFKCKYCDYYGHGCTRSPWNGQVAVKIEQEEGE